MNNYCKTAVAAILAFASATVSAIDTSEPFLCASIQVNECIDGEGCQPVLPEEVNAPTFVRVDVKKKQLIVFDNVPPTKILSSTVVENRLILQGAEDGNPAQPDGTGWTMSIEEETGRFVGTAAVLQGAIVIFGACTEI